MPGIFKNDWSDVIVSELEKEYFDALNVFLNAEYMEQKIFPSREDIFNAFHLTAFRDVKVVILGQDPYHGEGQAHGLCFSVQLGIKPPPSLVNIFKELREDVGVNVSGHGNLESWAKQGVFLLNTTLTVRSAQPLSHQGRGWEIFTDRVIDALGNREQPTVFILWGSHAQKKRKMIDETKHYVIASPHPSPLSSYRGFFGSKPFSRANEFLQSKGLKEVDWTLGL